MLFFSHKYHLFYHAFHALFTVTIKLVWKIYFKKKSFFPFDFLATLDNLETKLSIQDDNDSVSTDTISENVDIKSESSTNSVDGKTTFVGQNGMVLYKKMEEKNHENILTNTERVND